MNHTEHVDAFKHQRECADCKTATDAYRNAIRQIAVTVGLGDRWATSILVHRYSDGVCEVFFQDFDNDADGAQQQFVLDMTEERAEAFASAVAAAAEQLRACSPTRKLRAFGWADHAYSHRQALQQRHINTLARKRKTVAIVKEEIRRLYEDEGCKWEYAVAMALTHSRLSRALKNELAQSEDWPLWMEAYAPQYAPQLTGDAIGDDSMDNYRRLRAAHRVHVDGEEV